MSLHHDVCFEVASAGDFARLYKQNRNGRVDLGVVLCVHPINKWRAAPNYEYDPNELLAIVRLIEKIPFTQSS